MDQKPDTEDTHSEVESEESTSRREFLRNSVYAAYATPLITLLLVDAKSAYASPNPNGCTNSGYQPPGCNE